MGKPSAVFKDDVDGESTDVLLVLEKTAWSMREKKAVCGTEMGQW